MNNMKLLGPLLSSVALVLTLAGPAQSTRTSVAIPASSNKTCQQAIDSVGRELASKGAFVPFETHVAPGGRVEPRVSIEDGLNGSFSQYRRGYPNNRPQQVKFMLSGDANRLWNGVMASPQFLTTLASQIMAACPQVGKVSYHHWFEGYVPVGYFSDGTARAFSWVDFDDPRVDQWGYYYSP